MGLGGHLLHFGKGGNLQQKQKRWAAEGRKMPDSCKVLALAQGHPSGQHRGRSPWQGLSQGGERQLLSW